MTNLKLKQQETNYNILINMKLKSINIQWEMVYLMDIYKTIISI